MAPESSPGSIRLFVALGYCYILAVLALLVAAMIWFTRAGDTFAVVARVAVPSIVALGLSLLTSLWVRMEAPAGIPVTARGAPRLFGLIERVRQRIGAPPVDEVRIMAHCNAAVAEVPRHGVFGLPRRYLVLGLPLLEAVSEEELTAILGHEFAHLHHQHVSRHRTALRLLISWRYLRLVMDGGGHWAGFLFRPFIRWYVPRYEAICSAQLRVNEFESDALGARVTGATVAAVALTRILITDRDLQRRVWPQMYARSAELASPPSDVFSRIPSILAAGAGEPALERLFHEALGVRTLDQHSHPSLADRLRALGLDPDDPATQGGMLAALRTAPEPSAATAAFGIGVLGSLRARLGETWSTTAATDWRRWRARAASGWQADPPRGPPAEGPEALRARAEWMAECAPSEDAIPMLREAVTAASSDADLLLLLGRLLLNGEPLQQPEGAVLLRRALRAESTAAFEAALLLEEYAARRGDAALQQVAAARRTELFQLQYRAILERANLSHADSLIVYRPPAPMLEHLRRALAAVPELRRAFLVRKLTQTLPDQPFVVLALDLDLPWYTSHQGRRAREIVAEMEEELTLPAGVNGIVVALQRRTRFARRVQREAGAECFSRGDVPPPPLARVRPARPKSRLGARSSGLRGLVPTMIVIGATVAVVSTARSSHRGLSLPELERYVQGHPSDAGAQADLGWKLIEVNRYPAAVEALRRAVELKPGDRRAQRGYAVALGETEDNAAALPHAQEAVRLDPRYALGEQTLGWVLSRLGRNEEAVAAYQRSLTLDPEEVHANFGLGWVLNRAGRPEEALPVLRRSLAQRPGDYGTLVELGWALGAVGHGAEGIPYLERAIRADSANWPAWQILARLSHSTGNDDRALSAYQQALARHPALFTESQFDRDLWVRIQANRYLPP